MHLDAAALVELTRADVPELETVVLTDCLNMATAPYLAEGLVVELALATPPQFFWQSPKQPPGQHGSETSVHRPMALFRETVSDT